MATRWLRAVSKLAACLALVAACSVEVESVVTRTNPNQPSDAITAAEQTPLESIDGPAGRGDRARPIAGVDSELVRADGVCVDEDDTDVGADRFRYVVAYQVVDGDLGSVCFGEPNEVVEESWRMLAEITPPDQLRDLAIFAGITTPGDTLAFVTTADGGLGSLFEMSINVGEASSDSDELSLTLAHEFSHVFTSTPSQLDRDARADDCDTFEVEEGCFRPDSLLAGWVIEFWPSHLADFDRDDNSEDSVVERCAIDPGFFGSYGATNPEEDFAESFAAYVMRVPAEGPSQQRRLDWIDDQGGLREFRDRAIAFGYGPLESNFDECGFASSD